MPINQEVKEINNLIGESESWASRLSYYTKVEN